MKKSTFLSCDLFLSFLPGFHTLRAANGIIFRKAQISSSIPLSFTGSFIFPEMSSSFIR